MLIKTAKNLNYVKSLKNPHSFSSLPISFGFVGREEKQKISNINFLKQVHGTQILPVKNEMHTSHKGPRPEADGLYTEKPEEKIAVRTADCLPLLLSDLNSNFVMALHAGWKGLSAGIIASAITTIKEKYKTKPSNLVIFMGPCISQEAFEVGPEVIKSFQKKAKDLMSEMVFKTCYKPGKENRSFFCLRSYAFYSLLSHGVLTHNISAYQTCTFLENHLWLSYRKEAPLKSHNWSWISLKTN